jgi:prolipoprotein diacylglyceryl transferase
MEWSVSPILFDFGFLQIRWYGLLFALGFVIGYQIMNWIYVREKQPLAKLETLTIVMILSTVLGARLGHCLFYEPEYYLSNPIKIFYVWQGGLASHGAAFGILLGLFIFHYRTKTNYLWILDRIVIVVALSGFFIRLGNFFNSEILGKPSDLPWAIVFSNIDKVPRHPAQLYEAISSFLIFLTLLLFYKNNFLSKAGQKFGFFLVSVFGLRFVWELFKMNQVAFENNLPYNMGQLLSVPFVLVGLFFLFIYSEKKENV